MQEQSLVWLKVNENNPPKDQPFIVWDERLKTVIEGVSWFCEPVNQFGTDTRAWSGDFKLWMPTTDQLHLIEDPYY